MFADACQSGGGAVGLCYCMRGIMTIDLNVPFRFALTFNHFQSAVISDINSARQSVSIIWQHFPLINNCRATLCTVRPMPSRGVCPSVCLSVKFEYCIETNKHILELFHRLVEHQSSFFCTKPYSNIVTPPPLTGVEYRLGFKNCDF